MTDGEAPAIACTLGRREGACCGFLRFDVRESAGAVRLTITAPPAAQDAADELFAHFPA